MQQTAPLCDILQDLNEHGMTRNPHKSPSGKSWRRSTGTRSASLQMYWHRYPVCFVCICTGAGTRLRDIRFKMYISVQPLTNHQSPKCRLHTCACERW